VDDDDDEGVGEEGGGGCKGDQVVKRKVTQAGDGGGAASQAVIDFAALERAGYRTSTDLRQTDTYKRLDEAAENEREADAARHAADQARRDEEKAAIERAKSELLDPQKIDERIGYKKRYAETGEDFRAKEKRKRLMGQQNRDGNYVEEEKRRLRHGETGNYDS